MKPILSTLKGLNSLHAYNAFHTLMLGLKMLPSYETESYEDFYARIDSMPVEDQERMIRESVRFVKLEPDEVEAMLSFASDSNGVAYGKQNIKNLGPLEISEIIIAVSLQIAQIKPDALLSDTEKKNLKISPSI